MSRETKQGSNGFLIICILVFVLTLAYIFYPFIIGPIGWSEKLTVTESGARPRIIHDDGSGTFVFWISDVFTHERKIELAEIMDNEVKQKGLVFTGNNLTEITDLVVYTDNSGSAFVFFETAEDNNYYEHLIITNLSNFISSDMRNLEDKMNIEIESVRSGDGKIIVLSYASVLYNFYSNETYKVIDIPTSGEITFFKELTNGNLAIISETIEETNATLKKLITHLTICDPNGNIIKTRIIESKTYDIEKRIDHYRDSYHALDLFFLDDGKVLVLREYDDYNEEKLLYLLYDENINKIKKGELKTGDFEYWSNYIYGTDEFNGKVIENEFIYAYLDPEFGLVIHTYDHDMKLKNERYLPLYFSDDAYVSINFNENDEIEIAYFDIPFKKDDYNDPVREGRLSYISEIDEGYNKLIIYFLVIIFIYIAFLFLYARLSSTKRKNIEEIKQHHEHEQLERHSKTKIEPKMKKLQKAKEENERGKLIFENKKMRFKQNFFIILFVLIFFSAFLFVLFYLLVALQYITTDWRIIFLVFVPVIQMIVFSSYSDQQIPTRFKIYENGLEVLGGPYFLNGHLQIGKRLTGFFWFTDIEDIELETWQYQKFRFFYPNLIIAMNFKHPEAPEITVNIKIELNNFFEIYSYLHKQFGPNISTLFKFITFSDYDLNKKYWHEFEKTQKRITKFKVGLSFLVFSIIYLSVLFFIYPFEIHISEHLLWTNNFGEFILNIIYLFIIPIIFILLIIRISSKRLWIENTIINLKLMGKSIPKNIEERLKGFLGKRSYLDLKSDKDLRYLKNFKNRSKKNIVRLNLSITLIVILFLIANFLISPAKYQLDKEFRFESTEKPYSPYYDFEIPESNQLHFYKNTVIKDQTIDLVDNITVESGSTVVLKGLNINFFENRNLSDYRSRMVIYVAPEAKLIMDNCAVNAIDSYNTKILCNGILEIRNCSFQNISNGVEVIFGSGKIENSQFLNCQNSIDLRDTDYIIDGVKIYSSYYPIMIQSSNVNISNCNIVQNNEIYGRRTGIGIVVQYYYNSRTSSIKNRMDIRNTVILNFEYGIKITIPNSLMRDKLYFYNNEIINCTYGLENSIENIDIRNNLFKHCEIALKTDIELDHQKLREENTIINNQVIIEQYYYQSIISYDWQSGSDYPWIWAYDKNSEPISVSKDINPRFDHIILEVQLLKEKIYQNQTRYSPFPYKIILVSDFDGIAQGVLNYPGEELNLSLKYDYDLYINYLTIENRDLYHPVFEATYFCSGRNVSNVTITAKINDIEIQSWNYDNLIANKQQSVFFNLSDNFNKSIYGDLSVEISSKEGIDVFPANNKISKRIWINNENYTSNDRFFGTDYIILKSGNVQISNLTLENSEKTIYLYVYRNASLTIENSIINNNQRYSVNKGYLLISCYGDLILNNAEISDISRIETYDINLTITHSRITNTHFWILNSNFSLINSTFLYSGPYRDYYSYYYRSNVTILNSKLINIQFIDYEGEYSGYSQWYINSNFIVSGSKFIDSVFSAVNKNLTIDNFTFNKSYMEIMNGETNLTHGILEGSRIYIYGFIYNVSISNIQSNNQSSIGLLHSDNFTLTNISFYNCNPAIYAEMAEVTFQNLYFINNNLDLNLTGDRSIQSFSDLTDVSKFINYHMDLNLIFSNESLKQMLYNNDFRYSFSLLNTQHEFIDIHGNDLESSKNANTFSIPVFRMDREGSKTFFGPYYIILDLWNNTLKAELKSDWIIDPKDITSDFEREFVVSIVEFEMRN